MFNKLFNRKKVVKTDELYIGDYKLYVVDGLLHITKNNVDNNFILDGENGSLELKFLSTTKARLGKSCFGS
jgi:hypothetical protein